MRRTVDLINEGRDAANLLDAANLSAVAELVRELAARLDHYAWAGSPPSTPHLAAAPPPPVKSAPARNVPCAALTVPQSVAASADSAGAGEVRLVETTAMPLTGPEFVDGDPTPPHGIVRSSGLWLVRL